ncbi:hypothetical protein AB7849_09385 [Rhodanobacter sp. 115]|uniref:hypothetical protein n=1 Tax=Rhodanobacter sp. FW021-MT20 TaxID=1162282 RepID=UPI0034E3D213
MRQQLHYAAFLCCARPVSFRYPSPYHEEYAAYAEQLVQGEILLRRLVEAHAAGVLPAHRRLTLLHEALFWHRPLVAPDGHQLAEYARWFSRAGMPRYRPLSVPQLTVELMEHYGLGERMVAMLLTRQSHGLQAGDQTWLERRRSLPVLSRPLLRTEYSELGDCVEAAYLGPPFGVNRSMNREPAIEAAALMGSIASSRWVPFRQPVLRSAFERAFQRPTPARVTKPGVAGVCMGSGGPEWAEASIT